MLAQGATDQAHVVVERGVVAGDRDGLGDELGGELVLALLVRDHAQQVQGLGVGRVRNEEAAIERPRRVEAPGPVMR